jgi:hypothetical protein
MKTMIAIAIYACFTAAGGHSVCEEHRLPHTAGSCASHHAQAQIAEWLNEHPEMELALAPDHSVYRCTTEPVDEVLAAVQNMDAGQARILEAPGMPTGWGTSKPSWFTPKAEWWRTAQR